MSIQKTFSNIRGRIDSSVSRGLKVKAKQIADYTVMISPVYSGAYVESFSIKARGEGGGRSRSSNARNAKKRSPNPDRHKMIALDQLYSDIAALGKDKIDGFVLRNRSPHVREVEDGSIENNVPAYKVFERVRRNFG